MLPASSRMGEMKEVARTSETSVDNYFTRQYIPEDNSELQAVKFFDDDDDDQHSTSAS
jgi:hypothetical protein